MLKVIKHLIENKIEFNYYFDLMYNADGVSFFIPSHSNCVTIIKQLNETNDWYGVLKDGECVNYRMFNELINYLKLG